MSSKDSENGENNQNKSNSSGPGSGSGSAAAAATATPTGGGGSSSSSTSAAAPSGGSSGKTVPYEAHQYVGPYRLEKTLGKGQTGRPRFTKKDNLTYI